MSIEMSSEIAIQHAEYVENGAYHRSWRNRLFGAYRYEIPLKFLPRDLTGTKSLDFGGGDGVMASYLSRRGSEAVVYDVDRIALELARKSDGKLAETQGSVNLPFADETFGVVTMLETLEHIPEGLDKTALGETRRVLTLDGILIASVPSVNVPVHKKHFRHYSAEKITADLAGAGFDNLQIYPVRRLKNPFRGGNPILRKATTAIMTGADSLVRNFSAEKNIGLRGCKPEEAEDFFIVAYKNQSRTA